MFDALLKHAESFADQFPRAGPILVFFVLIAISVGLVKSTGVPGKIVCIASLIGALVAAAYACFIWSPPLDENKKFVTELPVSDPCLWGMQNISKFFVPARNSYVTPYAMVDFENSQIILLLSSSKPLNVGTIDTVYARLRDSVDNLPFCMKDITQVDVISLLPEYSNAGQPNCPASSSVRFIFWASKDQGKTRTPLCAP